MRQDLLHCVVVASYANAARRGDVVVLPRHPAFRSLQRLVFVDAVGAELTWETWWRGGNETVHLACAPRVGVIDDGVLWAHDGESRLRRDDPAASSAVPVHDAARKLGEALERVIAEALPRQEIRRAAAILRSPATGEELSDVAWPHFLLPASAPLAARRLAAAAATAWVFGGDFGSDLVAVRDSTEAIDELRHGVTRGLCAAVAAA